MNMASSGGIASAHSTVPFDALYGVTAAPPRILIVGGNAIERDVMSRKFTGQGYVCECRETAQAALELLGDEEFDLVLTDTATPEGGIGPFLSEVLRIRPDAAVILTTSTEDIDEAVAALKDGAYDWCTRPFGPGEIAMSVSRALEKRQLRMENRNYQRTLEEQVSSRTSQLQEALKVLDLTYHSTLVALGRALDSRDKDSAGRAPRVAAYARRLAQQLGLGQREVREIEQGALLHDIGKIGIPDALLGKRELTEEEERVMRTHPEIGYNILSGIKFLKGTALLTLQSHERYDGNGFPQGLRGEEISLGARILAVADAFEDLASEASAATRNISDILDPLDMLETPRAVTEALEGLKRLAGGKLDPRLVGEFVRIHADEWAQIRESASARSRRPRPPRLT
ncbi:MAG: HD domain-containing protein [Acidobacteriota bacterium]|jgi:response regulator RpfG family c-di-GMP phosphodiesterase|nr:HD domain-containing protein [Acidobacteriota bacterium]